MRREFSFITFLILLVTGMVLLWTRPRAQAAETLSSVQQLPSPIQTDLPMPNPSLTPSEVVLLQLDALQRNDRPRPEAGIETAFNFASPGNKRATGPLPRFIRMVHNPTYAPMIDHRSHRLGKMKLYEGGIAVIDVALVGADGTPSFYRFQLSRQKKNLYNGCWMTDAVTPLKGNFI